MRTVAPIPNPFASYGPIFLPQETAALQAGTDLLRTLSVDSALPPDIPATVGAVFPEDVSARLWREASFRRIPLDGETFVFGPDGSLAYASTTHSYRLPFRNSIGIRPVEFLTSVEYWPRHLAALPFGPAIRRNTARPNPLEDVYHELWLASRRALFEVAFSRLQR